MKTKAWKEFQVLPDEDFKTAILMMLIESTKLLWKTISTRRKDEKKILPEIIDLKNRVSEPKNTIERPSRRIMKSKVKQVHLRIS